MIHFSKYDCDRSIPSAIDGLKISTRKILYSGLKENYTKEIKVAQFSGYVSEHSGYHHGEMSLIKAIVGMAQEFVGSNNINLFLPNGQFGSRIKGGKDSASERYIYTLLNNITEKIFRPEDGPVLNYLDDDGFMVEPDYYMPIIPFVLVNGGKGIGTGFSYDGLSYNPKDIIHYLRKKLKKEDVETIDFMPYFEGFKGDVLRVESNEFGDKYLIKGVYESVSYDTIKITELPIGTWSENYKEFLETLMDDKGKKKPLIKMYKDSCTDTIVDFTIKFYPNTLPSLLTTKYDKNINMLEKKLKLTTTRLTTNMNLFDKDHRLKKYKNPCDIIDEYIPVRYECYVKRKEYQLNELTEIIKVLRNKARFIKEQCDDTIDLKKKKSDVVFNLLQERKYDLIDGTYSYLMKMPISSVIEEFIVKLINEKEKNEELKKLLNTSIEDIWINELNDLEQSYNNYLINRKQEIHLKK